MSEETTSDVQTLSSENMDEFMTQRLNLAQEAEIAEDAEIIEENPETTEEIEEEHEEEKAEDKPEKKGNKLEKRFSELTRARDEAKQQAQTEREARLALEARLQALEGKQAKQEEPAAVESSEPKPEDYADAFQYAKALAKYETEQALAARDRQDAEKIKQQEQAKVVEGWKSRVDQAKSEIEDYDEVMASSDIVVSNEIRDALIESDVGPKVAYYLATNPEAAEELSKMPLAKAMKEFGKLEAKFESAKSEPAEEKPKPKVTASKAPEPISPIKSTAISDNGLDEKGEVAVSYEQFKALRLAGKIK